MFFKCIHFLKLPQTFLNLIHTYKIFRDILYPFLGSLAHLRITFYTYLCTYLHLLNE